jgi:hypothetical protein
MIPTPNAPLESKPLPKNPSTYARIRGLSRLERQGFKVLKRYLIRQRHYIFYIRCMVATIRVDENCYAKSR